MKQNILVVFRWSDEKITDYLTVERNYELPRFTFPLNLNPARWTADSEWVNQKTLFSPNLGEMDRNNQSHRHRLGPRPTDLVAKPRALHPRGEKGNQISSMDLHRGRLEDSKGSDY